MAWAKLNAPDAVKVVESVLVSKLPDDKVAEWIDSQDHNAPWGFTIEPGRQSVTLKTVSSNE